MKLLNKIVLTVLMAFAAMSVSVVYAQNLNPSNLSSSPYTRYGIGRLSNVGNTSTRAMGDLGVALRTNEFTNLYNPASLTAIDTLTMLFDTAIEGQYFMQKENGASHSDWDAGFSYLSFHFPLWNHWAGAISYMPYSLVGYEFGSTDNQSIENELFQNDTLRTTSSGNGLGGLQHFQLSLAWELLHGKKHRLSLGANAGLIRGIVQHNSMMAVTSGQAYSTYVEREFSAKGFDLLFGAQYSVRTSAERQLTFGATFAPRTPLSMESRVQAIANTDSLLVDLDYDLSAPMKFGVGFNYEILRKLNVGVEYTFENWNKVAGMDVNLNKKENLYNNVNRVALGFDYLPRTYSNNYFKTCHYRAGLNVSNSYVEAYGSQNMEYTASCGIGMPLHRSLQYNRGQFNMSLSYTRVQPKQSGLLAENYLHLTIGITYNEMMFFRNRLR